MKTEVINTRVEPKLKKSAEAVFSAVGLSTSEAVTLFLHQTVLHKGLPFDVKIPNKKTRKAMKETLAGKNYKEYRSLDDMKREYE